MIIHLANIIASVGYVGKIRWMPGTFGSIVAILLSFYIKPTLFSIFVLSFISFLSVYVIVKTIDDIDPKWVVVDEVIGVWIALYLHELIFPIVNLKSVFLIFVLFRFFDIIKPWPIRQIEQKFNNMRSSSGIIIDDMVAGVMTAFASISIVSSFPFF